MADVTFSANLQPAPACYPPDVNALLTLIATQGLRGTVPDNAGGGIYVGSIPPSSSLTNKVWFKIDAAGRPLGVYMFYNGNWRKVYTGLAYGEIRAWAGSPNYFDGTGRAAVGGDLDGWALCNGQNGTPNLEAYFMVGGIWGAANDGSGITNWVTDTDGQYWRHTGGARGPHRIIANQHLPVLHSQVWGYRGQTGTTGGPFSHVGFPGDPNATFLGNLWSIAETVGSPNNPMPLPLFYAVAYIMFVGYQ